MLTSEKHAELNAFSVEIKKAVVTMISHLGIGHVGGSLSITDLLAVLYGKQMRYRPDEPRWDGRDWLVCSKGHAGPAIYAALALKGFFPKEELMTLNRPGTNLPSHCDRNRTKGIDMTTGSLGQGASSAAGIALAHKMDGKPNQVYLVLGDGEMDEGQVWEMALFAPHHRLDNLIAFVDYNHMQLDGTTEEILDLGDLAAKFAGFGWHAATINGHDLGQIDDAIEAAKAAGKPSIIVMNTHKGHGWKRIEDTASSHSMAVTPADLQEALADMDAMLAGTAKTQEVAQ